MALFVGRHQQRLGIEAKDVIVTKTGKPLTDEEFDRLREFALALGYEHVESGPLVRSSYHAEEHVPGR